MNRKARAILARKNKAILARNIRNKVWQNCESEGVYAKSGIWDQLGNKSRNEKKILKQKKTKEKDFNERLGPPPGSGKKRK